MISRSTASTATRATRVAIHTQAETVNEDLRQTRFDAVSAPASERARRRAAVGGLFRRPQDGRPPAPGTLGKAFRVDETDAREYSPPTEAIVSHAETQWQ